MYDSPSFLSQEIAPSVLVVNIASIKIESQSWRPSRNERGEKAAQLPPNPRTGKAFQAFSPRKLHQIRTLRFASSETR
jgi:hypothetical protein